MQYEAGTPVVEAAIPQPEVGEAEAVGVADLRSQEDVPRTHPKSGSQRRCLESSATADKMKALQCVRMATSAWLSL